MADEPKAAFHTHANYLKAFPELAVDGSGGRRSLLAGETLLVHEACIGGLVGFDRLLSWVDQWIQGKLPTGLEVGLPERRAVLQGFRP